jgi:hypothetical protein
MDIERPEGMLTVQIKESRNVSFQVIDIGNDVVRPVLDLIFFECLILNLVIFHVFFKIFE